MLKYESSFGGESILRYVVYIIKKELYKYTGTEAQHPVVSKQVFLEENSKLLYMEDDENAAVRAAVPCIGKMPRQTVHTKRSLLTKRFLQNLFRLIKCTIGGMFQAV